MSPGEQRTFDLLTKDPQKLFKMYEHYQEMLMREDVAGWWQEQYMMADAERNQLKKQVKTEYHTGFDDACNGSPRIPPE